MASIAMTPPLAPGERAARPSFVGVVRGEIFKVVRQRFNWLTLLGLAGAVSFFFLLLMTLSGAKDNLKRAPYESLYHTMARELTITRVFIGIVLIIATAQMFGFEYQHGTIRVLLARGVDRVGLLLGKLTAIIVLGLATLAATLGLIALLTAVTTLIITGNLDALNALNGTFWYNTWLYILSMLVSMGVTILLTTAVTVFGRSLAIGATVGIGWFAAENILTPIMTLVAAATKNDFWLKLTAYFLGPELNLLPTQIVAPHAGGQPVESLGATPLVTYDLTHTLVTIAVYAAIFLAASILLAWRRDVKE